MTGLDFGRSDSDVLTATAATLQRRMEEEANRAIYHSGACPNDAIGAAQGLAVAMDQARYEARWQVCPSCGWGRNVYYRKNALYLLSDASATYAYPSTMRPVYQGETEQGVTVSFDFGDRAEPWLWVNKSTHAIRDIPASELPGLRESCSNSPDLGQWRAVVVEPRNGNDRQP